MGATGRLVLLDGRIADHKLDEGGRATAAHEVGVLAVDEVGNFYRYVLNDSDSAIDQYDVCTYSTRASWIVTQDISEGNAEEPAGVYSESTQIAVSEYFWLQCGGYGIANSETATSIAAGEAIKAHATADGECDFPAVGATHSDAVDHEQFGLIFGYALDVEAAGTPDTIAFRFSGIL